MEEGLSGGLGVDSEFSLWSPEGWSRSVSYTQQSASSMEVHSWQNMEQHFECNWICNRLHAWFPDSVRRKMKIVHNSFDDQIIVSNIFWSQFLKFEDLMLFFVISDRKWTKVLDQKIHFEDVTPETVMTIVHNFL